MTTFKDFLFEQEDIIDNRSGWGQVPKNEDVDYFGLRVKMKPSTFLELAETLPHIDKEKIQVIADHIKQGGKIGAPFLEIRLPDEWKEDNSNLSSDPDVRRLQLKQAMAKVDDHDGRHRMIAIQQLYGDVPIETHLFFGPGIRSRHIKEEWIESMSNVMRSQEGDVVRGPLFEVIQ